MAAVSVGRLVPVLWCTLFGTVLLAADVKGLIVCQCSTAECRAEGRSTCTAAHSCYSELFQDTLTWGCIDEGSPLLCENRRPQGKGIHHWPVLFCCNDSPLCNKDVAPPSSASSPDHINNASVAEDVGSDIAVTATTPTPDDKNPHPTPSTEPRNHHHRHHNDHINDHNTDTPTRLCQDTGDQPQDSSSSIVSSSRGSSRVINPIYIAVPAAGVCILLALIIFAMYLLRRRRHHYHHDSYYNPYYHDHNHHHHHQQQQRHNNGFPPTYSSSTSSSSPLSGKKRSQGKGIVGRFGGSSGGGREGGKGGGVPLFLPQPQHHCQCVCQQMLHPCHSGGLGVVGEEGVGDRLNRCTDSERSSSGSETKLFLQA